MTENEAAAGKPGEDSANLESTHSDGVVQVGGTGQDEPGGDAPLSEIDALKAEAAENWNKYLRCVADLENLRKRNARDVEQARNFGIDRLVDAILPVKDSLEAALKVATDADPASVEISTLIEGDRATLRLLDQALESVGIAEIDPEGEPFNPECHEAISMLASPTAEPNSVINVVQKGFSLRGRVVRPARVVVARAPAQDDGN